MRRLFIFAFLIAVPILATDSNPLREGDTLSLNNLTLQITRLDALLCVQSDYTRRFKFDSADNPKLKDLREAYHLDELVAPGKDEFDKQVILNDWVHHRFKKFGQPSTKSRGALEVLKAIDEGATFFCAQYADTLVSAAASLGWIDRELALRRHQGANAHGGSTEHSTTEIWSNQYGKWIMLDPTSNMYLEANGTPLNGWEIRQEWFYHQGTNLTFVIGKERARYHKSDLPIYLERFKDFGDLTIDPDELDKYGFIGYIPNTNLMDAGNDYGQMFITKDKLCEGTKWHERVLPANPAVDPYFPVDQAAIEVRQDANQLRVELKTFTPNFKTFEIKIDDNNWKPASSSVTFTPHAGKNRFQSRAINSFGVAGPLSTLEVTSR